jgi:pimeloyl-ACP methyl ester carboxylesterase
MSALAKGGKALVLGTLAAAFGVGAVAGVVAERALIGRNLRKTPGATEPFGSLHSEKIEVVAIDGVKLHAEVDDAFDDSNEVTILFSHGYALRMDEFHFQRRDLRHIARMAFYDHRGHGKSEAGNRENRTIWQLGSDLNSVIEKVCPTGDIVLVGHSMGGMSVQALAKSNPELFGSRIKAVILICTSSGGVTQVPLGLPDFIGKFIQGIAPGVTNVLAGEQNFVDKSREAGNDLTLLLTRRYSFGSEVSVELTEFVADMHGHTSIEVIGDYLKAISEFDGKEFLPILQNVSTTVLVAKDDLLTPISHSEEIAKLVPNSELIVVPESGHMLPMEKYLELNEVITNVVKKVRTSA